MNENRNQGNEAAVTSLSIHKQLQAVAAQELAALPQYLESLKPAERVRFLLAILPYTAPRVETCKPHYGEGVIGELLDG